MTDFTDKFFVQATTDSRNSRAPLQSIPDEILFHPDNLTPRNNSGNAVLETQMTVKTQIVKNIDGGILVTESCTDGEAVVAAETDEFLPI